jgi:hypothetical protein
MSTLTPANLNNIVLNENAYFYRSKKTISKTDIMKAFSESLADKKASRKYQARIREPLFNGPTAIAKFSLDIFEFKHSPSFLEKPEPGKWETKFGLFLILEYKGYVAVIRRNVSGVKSLDKMVANIDYDILAYFLTTQKSKFEKIVSSNMNTAENAIQTKSSEAIDLKGILSRFGASKQILNAIRIDNGGVKNTVALNTSRVNSFKLKNKFETTLFWLVDILKEIDRAFTAMPKNSFLDGFAKSLKFTDVIDDLEPTYVLLRFGALKSEIEEGNITRCYKRDDIGVEVDFDLLAFINANEKLFKLTKENSKTFSNGELSVKKNLHSITISNDEFKEILLDYGNGNTLTLNQYINSGQHFMVNFDKVEYVYSHGKIFKDSKLLGDTETFLETFITYPSISSITSEKGSSYVTSTTAFKPDSLFRFIENEYSPATECMICDDMGVEWGDYISIDKNSITFFHAKCHSGGLSASNLEEVFGQAQKNFGSLELTEEMIDYRAKRWVKQYKIGGVQTQIDRIRKCPTRTNQIQTIKELVYNASSSANFRRKVFIVVNFISKADLKKSIEDIKNGNQFVQNGVPLQILWFVNSLLCSAYELNTELRIICKP